MTALVSKHAELLNSLSDMQQSIAYAARKKVLVDAERLIVSQEQELKKLRDEIYDLREQLEAAEEDCQAIIETFEN